MSEIIKNKYGEGDLDIGGYEDIGMFQFNQDVQDIQIQLWSWGDEFEKAEYDITLWIDGSWDTRYSTKHRYD